MRVWIPVRLGTWRQVHFALRIYEECTQTTVEEAMFALTGADTVGIGTGIPALTYWTESSTARQPSWYLGWHLSLRAQA